MAIKQTVFKSDALKAAKDFNYGRDVIKQLQAAKTDAEVDRIMKTARHAKFDKMNVSPKKVVCSVPPETVSVEKASEVLDEVSDDNVKTYQCSKVGRKCKYSSIVNATWMTCDYLLMTGERRGCNPEKCTRYKSRNNDGKRIFKLKF